MTGVIENKNRVVTFEDGSQVDFGAKANVLVDLDVEAGTVTFLLSDATKIVWTAEEVAALTPFQLHVFLYGIAAKVKASLAPLKDLAAIATTINKQLASISEGTFILRSGKESKPTLSNIQKAYAIVKSDEEAFASWKDLDSEVVVREVLARWEALTVPQRNSIRKNAYVKLALSQLEKETAKVVELP